MVIGRKTSVFADGDLPPHPAGDETEASLSSRPVRLGKPSY